VCEQCQKLRSNLIINGEQRQLFLEAQRVSPVRFAESVKNQGENIREVSAILRRLISSILGRKTVEEKILTANL
jgi:hypothetical protein